MGKTFIGVLVVEHQPRVRTEIVRSIEAMPGMEVVGVAANGLEAVLATKRCKPDVVLMDLELPVMGGFEATTRLRSSECRPKVIAFTECDDDEHFHLALRSGVSGFILKSAHRGEVMHAIQEVHRGEVMISPRLMTRVMSRYGPMLTPCQAVEALPERSKRLLGLIGTGMSNEEIADLLHLSPVTVKAYVSRLLRALGARDRAQLVVIAFKNGLAVA